MTWGQAKSFGWNILLNPWFLGRKGRIVISGIEWDALLYVFSHGSCGRLFLCFLVWRISRPMASFLESFSDRRPPDQQKPQAYSNNSSCFKPNPSFNWCLCFWGWHVAFWSLWLPNPLQKHFILLQDDWAEQQVLAQKRTSLSWEPRWGLGIAQVDLELRDSDPWESPQSAFGQMESCRPMSSSVGYIYGDCFLGLLPTATYGPNYLLVSPLDLWAVSPW